MSIPDLTGQRFGKWTVLSQLPKTVTKSGVNAYWVLCRCDCGTEKPVNQGSLRTGASKSCGCVFPGNRRKDITRHGYSSSSTYRSWTAMLNRCNNKNNESIYSFYGGRGITVCERWHSFENFLADMGERPKGLSIDRIDTNGNYEPENCRWATSLEQMSNRRTTRRIEYLSQMVTARELHNLTGLPFNVLSWRIHENWPIDKILSTPLPKRYLDNA